MPMQFARDEPELADVGLLPYATDRQVAFITEINKNGSLSQAARELGVNRCVLQRSMAALRARAALRGYSPQHGLNTPIAPGFTARGHSTLEKIAPDGTRTAVMQWTKTRADDEVREELMRAAFEAMAEEMPRLEPIDSAVPVCDADLLTIYPQGDPHAGLASWKEETGSHFDLAEFERLTKAAIDRLVAAAPPSATAIYNDKGDLTHADNNKNRTPRSGHELDVQGRHSEVVRVALRCKRHHIARMLEKHAKVIVRIDPGNHDGETALMIALMLAALYENEPRVEVITNPNPYWYYRFGKNLIGTCHGDGAKGKDLPSIMANDAREWWGLAEHCLWLVGHIHHKDIKEYTGCTVEYMRTLAAPDAYSHGAGYRSKRDMQAITLHAEWGEVERSTVSAAMVS